MSALIQRLSHNPLLRVFARTHTPDDCVIQTVARAQQTIAEALKRLDEEGSDDAAAARNNTRRSRRRPRAV